MTRGRAAALLTVLVATAAAGVHHGNAGAPQRVAALGRPVRSGAARPAPARPRLRVQRRMLGRSVQGRAIYAYELGNRDARRKVLVVGCIHGDEAAGVAVVRRLRDHLPRRSLDLWLVPTINPDGQAAAARQNADGVDLNRNFPWHWRPLGPRGSQQYSGPRALSEPETRIAHSLIVSLRPAMTIWFHQPLGLVDESGGSVAVERRFARLAHMPLRRLIRYPGSAASWQNNRISKTSAFVVELPPGRPTPQQVGRWARAVWETATTMPG